MQYCWLFFDLGKFLNWNTSVLNIDTEYWRFILPYIFNFFFFFRLPPESIKENQFILPSDVWSYGITLWEMFSFGQTPWAEMSLLQVWPRLKARCLLYSVSVLNKVLANDCRLTLYLKPEKVSTAEIFSFFFFFPHKYTLQILYKKNKQIDYFTLLPNGSSCCCCCCLKWLFSLSLTPQYCYVYILH